MISCWSSYRSEVNCIGPRSSPPRPGANTVDLRPVTGPTGNHLINYIIVMGFVIENLSPRLNMTAYIRFCLFNLTLYVPVNSYVRTCLPRLNQYQVRINASFSKTQRSYVGEARTRNFSISRQALYHCASYRLVLLIYISNSKKKQKKKQKQQQQKKNRLRGWARLAYNFIPQKHIIHF